MTQRTLIVKIFVFMAHGHPAPHSVSQQLSSSSLLQTQLELNWAPHVLETAHKLGGLRS